MPRMDTAIYAAHMDNVLKLAQRDGGVSRPELIKELNVSRAVVNGLIEKAGLELDRKDGRTEYFKKGSDKPDVKQSITKPEQPNKPEPKDEAIKESVEPTSDSTGESDTFEEALIELDKRIVDIRDTLRKAAMKAGTALAEYATHQAMVDACKSDLQRLVEERLKLIR